jgi:hypothetical protein
VRYFDGKTYVWVGLSRQPNIISKVRSLDVQANELSCKACSTAGSFLSFGGCSSLREHIGSQTVGDVCPALVP